MERQPEFLPQVITEVESKTDGPILQLVVVGVGGLRQSVLAVGVPLKSLEISALVANCLRGFL